MKATDQRLKQFSIWLLFSITMGFGPLLPEAGAETYLLVETEPDGSGYPLPETVLETGDVLTVYAIARDDQGDFPELVVDSDWALQEIEGDVQPEDLVNNGDGSATFTADESGSALAEATHSGMTSVPSERIHVTSDSVLPDDEGDDTFAGTWHGWMKGENNAVVYKDIGFSMRIMNLEIGMLQPPGGDMENYFREVEGNASTTYRQPVPREYGVRAFLNTYALSGALDGIMETGGWTIEDGELAENNGVFDFECDNWQPGGYEEQLTQYGWVWYDDFDGGLLSLSLVPSIQEILWEPSADKNQLVLSKTSNLYPDLGYHVEGVLYRITHEEDLDYPDDFMDERVQTDKHTRKWINIPDVAEVQVSPGSEVEVSQDVDATCLDQFTGKLRHEVKQLDPNHTYEVQPPQAVLGVRGTTFWTMVEDDGQTSSVDLLEGEIEIGGILQSVQAANDSEFTVLDATVDETSGSDTARALILEDGKTLNHHAYDSSTLSVLGGSVGQARATQSSRVEVANGSVGHLRVESNAVAEIYGGEVDSLAVVGPSAVQVYGEEIVLDEGLEWGDDNEVLGTGTISGQWLNPGTAFAIEVERNEEDARLEVISESPATDSGIEYSWLTEHNLPTDGSVDQEDLEGKGMTVQEEYIADTDPHDADSIFEIEQIEKADEVEIHYVPDSNRRIYTLWSSEDLEKWEPVTGQESVPGGDAPLSDDPAEDEDKLFYRIEAEVE